jgi:hypothetical protein
VTDGFSVAGAASAPTRSELRRIKEFANHTDLNVTALDAVTDQAPRSPVTQREIIPDPLPPVN